MTGTTTTTPPDVDPARFPDAVDPCDEDDVHHVTSEADDADTDEAGYGYGV